MKRFFHNYGVLGFSLVALFASGVSIGRFASPRATNPASPVADPPGGPESWVTVASQGLVRDLKLDGTQERQIRQQLEPVAAALYADQERALFQMHLRLLLFHDTLAKKGGLDDTQLTRLAVSRAKLKGLIIRKFPTMVRRNPSLALDGGNE
jgi:hypothetical protein